MKSREGKYPPPDDLARLIRHWMTTWPNAQITSEKHEAALSAHLAASGARDGRWHRSRRRRARAGNGWSNSGKSWCLRSMRKGALCCASKRRSSASTKCSASLTKNVKPSSSASANRRNRARHFGVSWRRCAASPLARAATHGIGTQLSVYRIIGWPRRLHRPLCDQSRTAYAIRRVRSCTAFADAWRSCWWMEPGNGLGFVDAETIHSSSPIAGRGRSDSCWAWSFPGFLAAKEG
jgi:hypothetical protein